MFHGGPEAERGTPGAVRHGGPRVEIFAHYRCQSEATQELPQNSGYGLDKPLAVQAGVHGFFRWLFA